MATKRKSAIAKKTAILIHEGKKPAQAYAMANSMAREGRLTSKGGYIRKHKKKASKNFGDIMP